AINSPRSVSVSGSETAIGAFVRFAQARNLAATVLDIDYPFHSSLLDGIRGQVIDALAATAPARARLPFYSTVLGRRVTGPRLGATYWWDNVRQPVRFADAVTAASTSGCRLFMEIGPRPILKRYVAETTADLDQAISVIHSLEREEPADTDPVWSSFARAMAAGAAFDPVRVFGRARHTAVQLPLYPWQNECCELAPSPEALEVFSLSVLPHPLLGQQLRRGEHVWQLELDVRLLPFLNDHKVDGQVILPGAAYAEMALAAAADWLGHEQVELRDMDIAQPLLLGDDYSVQVRTRLSVESGTVE